MRLQVHPTKYNGPLDCIKKTIAEDGLIGFYRGWIPPVAAQGIINALVFVGEYMAMRCLEPELEHGKVGSPVNTFLAGSFGGLVQCIALVPTDVVKCTMQVETTIVSTGVTSFQYMGRSSSTYSANVSHARHAFSDTFDCIRRIYKRDGVMGFYKGTGATALREVPSIGLYFFVYKNCRELLTRLQGHTEHSSFTTLLSGGMAGACSWTTVYPTDVIKTYMQTPPQASASPAVSSAGAAASSHSEGSVTANLRGLVSPLKSTEQKLTNYGDMKIWQVAVDLYKRHGYRVFFRGLGTTIVRAFPVNAATFFFYEKFKAHLHFHLF